MKKTYLIALLGTLAFASVSHAAPMALIDPGLTGITDYDQWNTLNAAAYPGYGSFPGSGAWPAPMQSQTGGDATLNKVSNGTGGGPYPASGSIYFGGFSGDFNVNGGTLAVKDNTALAGLSELFFQIQIGEASTYDFWNGVLPTLSYNGGTQNLAATNSDLLEAYYNGTVTMPTGEEPIYINTYGLTWDLSSIGVPITDFTISFTGVQHAQLYKLRVDQAAASAEAVPDSGTTLAMMIPAIFAIGAVARRTRERGLALA